MVQSDAAGRKSRTKQYYDDISTDYEVLHGIGCPGGDFALRNIYAPILRAQLDGVNKVLEFGCGTGKFTILLSAIAKQVIATDISPRMVSLAQEKVKLDNIQFQVADTENLPFHDGEFDAVVGVNTLSYCTNKRRAIQDLRRVLKKGGSLIIIDMNYLCPLYHAKGLFNPRRYFLFFMDLIKSNRWFLTSLLKEEGFSVDEKFEFLWIPHSSSISTLRWMRPIDRVLSKTPIIRNFAMRFFLKASKV